MLFLHFTMAIFGKANVLGLGVEGQDLAGSRSGAVLVGEATLAWISSKKGATRREGRVGMVWKKDWGFDQILLVRGLRSIGTVNGLGGTGVF